MSVEYCEKCNKHIDTDFDAEHFEEHEEDEKYEVVEAMRKYGGSFVRALAEAFARADNNNFNKLKNAFPEYWKQYREFAKK